MRKFFTGYAGLAALSGLLSAYAISQESFVLAWVCFIPLFIVLDNWTEKSSFKPGLWFGLSISLVGFYWMVPGAQRFTGSSIVFGIIVYIISSAFFCLFFGLITFSFGKLRTAINGKGAIIRNSLLMAAIFCIAEALLTIVSNGFPWFDFHAGYCIITNLYAIQPAEYFGIPAMSFIVILVNYLFAAVINQKQWVRLMIPAGAIVVYILIGYLIQLHFEANLKPGKPVNIAIMSENVAPEIMWNNTTGNHLAGRLLDMNRTAVTLRPDIALWSESAIPWTYKKDDDLVNAVIKITKPANITHILGINTEDKGNMVYNSAYCLLPDGTMTGRYDKQVLLSLIEKPIGGALIPFMSSNGFIAITGEHNKPLNTPYGKAGIIICNESAVPSTAYAAADKGAEFLCNLSNDGWFNNTYIVGLHFSNARLRAVETRKDIAINSNDGYSGMVKASGEIMSQERSDEALVKLVTVNKNNYSTLVVSYPYLFVCLCGLLLIGLSVFRFLPAKTT